MQPRVCLRIAFVLTAIFSLALAVPWGQSELKFRIIQFSIGDLNFKLNI